MLTGKRIIEEIADGGIVIDPFNPDYVNPNSINVHLGSTILTYTVVVLDPRENNPTVEYEIPATGLVIHPGILYLGTTKEYTESHTAVPMINGRSSLARLGITIHQTGGFGDIGFCGCFTLEISCIQPVRIYAGMSIAQICWFYPVGEVTPYDGKYQGQREPTSSRYFLEKLK